MSGCSLCHISCQLFLLKGWTTNEVFQRFLRSFPVGPFCAALGLFVFEVVFVCWLASPVVVCLLALLGFRSVGKLIRKGKVSCEESASRVGFVVVLSKVVASTFSQRSLCFVNSAVSRTVRVGLMHLW